VSFERVVFGISSNVVLVIPWLAVQGQTRCKQAAVSSDFQYVVISVVLVAQLQGRPAITSHEVQQLPVLHNNNCNKQRLCYITIIPIGQLSGLGLAGLALQHISYIGVLWREREWTDNRKLKVVGAAPHIEDGQCSSHDIQSVHCQHRIGSEYCPCCQC
jgi:hypothetical protein